jgi:hypothetical protein
MARQDEGAHSKGTKHFAKARAEQRCGARWISGTYGAARPGEREHSKVQGMGGKWRRYLSVPARCGGSTATTGTLADDGRCVVLPTKPRAMILAVVCFCLTRVLWHLSCVIHQRTQSHPPVSKTL